MIDASRSRPRDRALERSRKHRAAVAASALLLVALLALILARIVSTMRHVEPVKPNTSPAVSAVVWGNRVFLTENALATWLKARGVEYRSWASRHRQALTVLKQKSPQRSD